MTSFYPLPFNTEKFRKFVILLYLMLVTVLLVVNAGAASVFDGKKIYIVMSYHDDAQSGESELKKYFDEYLSDAELRYFWLDTKINPESGPAKAKEAYKVYKVFAPDLVIAANDNAQSHFVVPFLRDKVKTPVVFCGVNDEAARYGYPAANVSGVLEKKHFGESINFAQLVMPSIKRIGVLYKENISNSINLQQIDEEKANYPVEMRPPLSVGTLNELKQAVVQLNKESDAFLVLNLSGITDENNNALENRDLLKLVVKSSDKPIIGVNDWQIEAGSLCGVIRLWSEQAKLAVDMAADILGGKPAGKIPITQNRNGQRQVNIATLKRLGINLAPAAVLGTDIITPTAKK